MLSHPLPYKLLIFDIDGTLRSCFNANQPCPNQPGDWYLLPHVRETLAQYQWGSTHQYACVTNQGGVALGFLTADACWQMLVATLEACGWPPWQTHTLYVCFHRPDARCPCRKPSPYLLLQAVDHAGVRLDETLYIGDLPSDQEAARRAGVAFLWAHEFFGWEPQP